MKTIGFVVAVMLLASEAFGCGKCGRIGSHCAYAVHAAPVVAVAPIVKQSDVFIVNNNYPGTPLVPQGQSLYQGASYGSQALPLLDPNQYFSQQLQLSRAINDTNAQQNARASAMFERVMELQAPVAERLAAGHAASLVLKSAGLDPAYNASGVQRQSVVVTHDANGQIQVMPLSSQQIQSLRVTERIETNIAPRANPPDVGAGAGGPLKKYCSSCHGLELASPKGLFYLGDDPNVAKGMETKFRKIANRLRSQGADRMPPEGSPQPSDQERAALVDEIDQIIAKHEAP